MTSVLASLRQVTPGSLYVNLDDLTDSIYTEAGATAMAADPTYTVPPVTVSWTVPATGAGTVYLKDMGKTISGNGLTFRKVQLVGEDAATFGVSGTPADIDPFQTGYILLGSGSALGALATTTTYLIAPVARTGL